MNLGGMAGALWGTNVGAATVAGVAGWRWAFAGVALASGGSGLLTYALARDPRTTQATRHDIDYASAWSAIRRILMLPTFIIVILQARGLYHWQGCWRGCQGTVCVFELCITDDGHVCRALQAPSRGLRWLGLPPTCS